MSPRCIFRLFLRRGERGLTAAFVALARLDVTDDHLATGSSRAGADGDALLTAISELVERLKEVQQQQSPLRPWRIDVSDLEWGVLSNPFSDSTQTRVEDPDRKRRYLSYR